MLLSSYERLRRYISSGTPLTNNTENKRQLTMWLTAVSRRIEQYLDRELQIQSRTKYYDSIYNRTVYPMSAVPVTAITSVYYDSTGEFTGSETELTDNYIGQDGRSIVLDYPQSPVPRSLRFIYTGGLAYHGVNSTFVITGESGTWTADKFAVGQTSGARGIYKSQETVASVTTYTIENLWGIFEAGEVIQEWDSEDAKGSSDGEATISSITTQSLAEAYGDIVTATEAEIRYMWKHKMDFENESTLQNQTTRRKFDRQNLYQLQLEAMSLLASYKRVYY